MSALRDVAVGHVAGVGARADGGLFAHGEDALPPFTPAAVFTEAELLSFAMAILVIAAGAYVWGVLRLRERGDSWPIGRTVLFLGGLAAIGSVTVTGIAAYDTALVSAHMIQHMVLSMIAPILLALGAPVTLALRTVPGRPRRLLLALVHSRYVRLLTYPLVSFSLFVANPFILYFSGLYRLSLENVFVHEWVHLHFVVVGCLFFWPLIGLDPVPGRVPYPMRALLMFLSTPFHTVLGLTVMQSADLLGGDWYPSLGLGWVDPFADQRLAGGILWAGGEFVAVTMLAALVIQWMRQSEREARRIDRALDRAEAAERAQAERAQAERAQAERAQAERAQAERAHAERAGESQTQAGAGVGPPGATAGTISEQPRHPENHR